MVDETGKRDALALLQKWRTSVAAIQDLHYKASHVYRSRHTQFGVFVTALSTSVTIILIWSVFYIEYALHARALGATLAAISIAGAGLLTSGKFDERAEMHQTAGVRFGSLLRRVDQILNIPSSQPSDMGPTMDELRTSWDEIQAAAPIIPPSLFQQRVDEIGRGELPSTQRR